MEIMPNCLRFGILLQFLLLPFTLNLVAQDINIEEQRISGLLAKLESENRTVEELSEKNLTNLPIGIKRTISNVKIIIAIDSARVVPQGMLINAYTQVSLPGTTKKITLAAKNVLVTPSGISQSNTSRLAVITDYEIPISDQVVLKLPADGSNYIEWDCNGFRSVNLHGLFEFSDQYFIPDPELSRKQKKVTANFEVNTVDFNNILIETSITPFRVKNMGDMTFVVDHASVDMSDFANSDGFVLPASYQNAFIDDLNLWRGFFLKDLTIYLPSELSSSSKRTSISAHNMLIDETGVSGNFSATNILPIKDGNASGWPFSINRISIGITQNKLTGGELGGSLAIPFLGNDTLVYTAQVESAPTGLQYYFAVATNTVRNYSLPLGGTVKLNKGCVFAMKVENGKFIPSAILNGSLSLSNEVVKAEGLRFEQLHLTTESPYILGGKFASSGGKGFELAGFGFGVDSISLGIVSGKASLAFNVKIALMNASDKGISASTRFVVKASVQKEPDASDASKSKQNWVYDGTQVQEIAVDASISIFTMKGKIALYRDDPAYGDGFRGNVSFAIKKILENPAQIEVYFGTKGNFKYWFTKIDVPVKIPVGPAINLEKLTGGAYNRMKRKDLMATKSDYLPDSTSGLGFMAGVGLTVVKDKLVYADVLFEIAFNTSGGVRYVRFSGDGQFFSGPEPKGTPPVKAGIVMLFDNDNDIFHANLKVYMNIAGAMKGIGPGGLLGEAVIHSDPKDWYIYIGRPSLPLGVDVLGLLKVQSYFMAGTKLENMPLPPSEVSSIIGNIDMDFMKKESAVATGKGVAFGMAFKMDFGFGKNGGFVYAYLNAGAGADIMLRDYGDVQCAGRSGPIGVDGWYASGQGYAYLQGKVGIRVKKKEFDIMSVAAALLLQAKMPNPSWFRGNIAARYSILGGLVKGKVNVEVTFGEECKIITNGSELGDIKLIGDITPAEGNREVDVFAAPQVAFNTSIDKEFGMVNIADQYNVYRVRLDDFKLITSNKQTIAGSVQWNDNRDVAVLKLLNILPGQQQITTAVKVHIERKTKGGWESLTDSKGIIDYETSEAKFITGDEPKTIPDNNVVYSYPVKNQYNFYKDEYSQGYIKLGMGQPNLFKAESEGKKWGYIARFKTLSGRTAESVVTYSESDATVLFNIPKTLVNSDVYAMTIVKKPVSTESLDQNLQRRDVMMETMNKEDSLSITQNTLTGTVSTGNETDLHAYSFRTSLYSTFGEKLGNVTNWGDRYAVDETLMSLLGVEASMHETFDLYELSGRGSDFAPLVYAEAKLGNQWLDQHVNPQVYELYGSTAGLALDRNTERLGLFPLKAMSIFNFNDNGYLLQGQQASAKNGNIAIRYWVPHYVYTDFCELRNKATAMFLGKPGTIPAQAQRLLTGYINDIHHGPYKFTLNYRLPGINKITTSKEYTINY